VKKVACLINDQKKELKNLGEAHKFAAFISLYCGWSQIMNINELASRRRRQNAQAEAALFNQLVRASPIIVSSSSYHLLTYSYEQTHTCMYTHQNLNGKQNKKNVEREGAIDEC
jgi:hypothetical protein